jgi:hypothetical protein
VVLSDRSPALLGARPVRRHGFPRFALSLQSLDELEAGMILAWDGEMVEVIDTVLDFDKVVNFAGDRVLVLLKVPEFPF